LGGVNVIIEKQRYGRNKSTQINKTYIGSAEYRRKFINLTDREYINNKIYIEAKKMLIHRSGTEYEDLVFINAENGKVLRNNNYAESAISFGINADEVIQKVMPTESMKNMLLNAEPNIIIALHNHPNNSLPSLADLRSAYKHKYKFSLVLTHNGKLFKFAVTDKFIENLADFTLGRLEKNMLYGDSEKITGYINELSEYGVILEVL
jgi:proteasome lid subunit RPN8/RPN11